MTVLISPERHWYCPNCKLEDVTKKPLPPGAGRFHTCPALRGLQAPMLPAGIRAKVELHEREDYIGTDKVTLDPAGRPVMSVVTTRDDGQDAVVFAPAAVGERT